MPVLPVNDQQRAIVDAVVEEHALDVAAESAAVERLPYRARASPGDDVGGDAIEDVGGGAAKMAPRLAPGALRFESLIAGLLRLRGASCWG